MTCLIRHSCILSLLVLCINACSDRSDTSLSNEVTDIDNPLTECPSSPNCYRTTLEYNVPAERLFNISREVLIDMDVSQLEADENKQFISAVFTIWLFRFKDDFTLKVESQNDKTYLHLRSSSRKGYSDLGVNRHRVNEFVKKIETKLENN